VTGAPPGAPPGVSDAALRRAAQALEAAFLSEMLKGAGLGEARDSFGGGVGEEQFASMLRDRQAEAMVQAGGIGLADSIFAALAGREAGK
jgi:Rod binding domain-containing protein